MTFDEWLTMGQERGWVGEPWCWVHDSPELTDEEMELTDEGEDLDAICVTAVRLLIPAYDEGAWR